MIIRKATTEDIPAIVQLLKASLGEVSSEKSVAYWNWKHVHNPFGASPVLLAEEGGQLVGVRAFMRWNWQQGNRLYRTLRAVDTATHPHWQGKGIFKKLTLQLVEQATREQVDFIFNTPNAQSRPGYLQMGWQPWGRMPLWLHGVYGVAAPDETLWQQGVDALQADPLHELPVVDPLRSGGLHTPLSRQWLQWRYRNCVAQQYALFQLQQNGNTLRLFVSRRTTRGLPELRIGTALFSAAPDLHLLTAAAVPLARALGCRLVTCGALTALPPLQVWTKGWLPIKRWSVAVTVRALSDPGRLPGAAIKTPWLLQTGDMELF